MTAHRASPRPQAVEEGAPRPADAATQQLRTRMPQCAAWIDHLRQQFGRDAVDARLRATARGVPAVYLAEVGADGVLREWGRAPSGRRAVQGPDGLMLGRPGRAGGNHAH